MKKIISILAAISILGVTLTAWAATEAVIGDDCNIAAYPYNPSSAPMYSEGGADAKVNFLTKTNAVSQTDCRNRVPYDQQHLQTDLNGQYGSVALDDTVQVPRATHIHNYVNDMKQDNNYYYRSFIYSFDIELEKDTLENTKLENIGNAVPEGFNLTCTTPSNTATPELHKCNGYNASAYGGTKVTIYEQPDRWVIRWSFGVNSAGEYEGARLANVPARWGNNTDLNTVLRDYLISKGLNPGNINLADQNSLYRKFDPEVTITSKNKTTAAEGNKSIWTGTTTSRVKVINYAIAKNRLQALNNGTINNTTFFEEYCTSSDDGKDYIYENNAWQECTGYQYWTPINSVSSSGLSLPSNYVNDTKINYKNSNGQTLHFNKAFWIAIGSVASVWKAPSSQTSTLACADLQWDGAFKKPSLMGMYMADTVNPNALLPDEKAIMKFKTIYQSGTGTQRPLEYRWVAFYGEQNRPAWFANLDSLYGSTLIDGAGQILQPMLNSSLPARLLRVAHAAPASAQPLGDSVISGSAMTTSTANMAELAAFIKIGDFKDEISATLSGNPLTDNDNQVFYSSGSEGVTVGVQAFYADGKNIPGDGPAVNTPDGIRQKANPCHLELVIQPKPVTCIDLDISPKTLEPNTPVTFTVTPKFYPANKSLPLNYRWSAEKYTSILGDLSLGNGILGAALSADPHDIQYIPGATEKETATPTWVGNGIYDVIQASSGLANLADPCFYGDCEQEEPSLVPLAPGDPIDAANVGSLAAQAFGGTTVGDAAGQAVSGVTTTGINEFFGTNIFADFDSPAEYGQAAAFNASSLYSNPSSSSASASQLSAAADSALIPMNLVYGGFKDAQSSPGLGANPYLETTDNKTYYTGGPANTLIKVQAEGKDGTLYPPCKESLVIPQGAICELLKVKFLANGAEVAKENLTADVSYQIEVDKANSVREDGTPIEKFAVLVMNSTGAGTLNPAPGNAASCSAIKKTVTGDQDYGTDVTVAYYTETSTSVNCKYIYVPKAGDKITMLADPHDNVAACRLDQTIPGAPDNLCELLKVKFFDGNTEVQKTDMVAGTTYRVEIDQANSVRDDGTPISKYTVVAYNPAGVGTMTAAPGNAASCTAVSDIPVINPGAEVQARGTQTSTPVSCKYLYTPNAGDKITLLADPHDNVAACRVDQVIPGGTEPICKDLNLQTNPALSGNQIAQGQLVAFAVNPVDTEDKPRSPVVYSETGNGYFVASPANPLPDCPAVPASGIFEAPKSCRYSYQAPNDGTSGTVTIKVKQDDGVPECLEEFIVKPTAKEICLALNLRVNGQYTLKPQIVPGQSYVIQADPVTTQGHAIQMVEWTETGEGKLIGAPSNPGICPAVIDNGAVSTLSICRYIFSSNSSATNVGFSVHAVPDDNVAACKANAENYIPPEVPPYCLYLDLDYTPEPFNPLTSSRMNATVVMSDGSPYSSQPGGLNRVRFTATNGAGNFSGGYGNTTGINTADFRTQTDNTNNTRNVNYQNGNANSGINVFLSDTNIRMSAACMRQLRPVPIFTPPCTIPPTIEHKDGNRYCAEGGDSESYCWTIDGPDNDLLFTNGRNTTTGDCVELDESYERFELLVEDCNPDFKDYCFDTLTNDETQETPTIEKRISKNISPLRYTTAVHFSTTGVTGAAAQTETVKYKVEYTPSNFEDEDGRSMTARIYDPAFSGEIRGLKINIDGTKSIPGGKIDFNVPSAFQITSPSGYSLCTSQNSNNDKCYEINETSSYMEIRGIDSDAPIIIEYNGTLTSGITIEDCRSGEWCNEEFKNQSRVDDLQYCEETTDENGVTTVECTTIDVPEIFSNTVIADVVCSYFLTRASGDVFLEDELTYGIDVSKCYPFKNVSSTIVKPIPPIEGGLASTGQTTPVVVTINHEICSAGQTDIPFANLPEAQQTELKKLFGSEISTLSSQICEVGLVPGSDWDKANIAAAMTQNIGKLTRWSSSLNPAATIANFSALEQASTGKVYYYNGNGETVTIDGLRIPEGSGALTIIVENADLQINGNIEYVEGTEPLTAEEIASLGVIVLDGNVKIDKDVEKLAGAYFVQRTTPDNYAVGNLFSIDKANPSDTTSNKVDSQKQLTVNGSIYGNIGPLFMHRISSGDITKDEGSITIRYDQRIIQNPPAGLTDLLGTFSQTQIAQ